MTIKRENACPAVVKQPSRTNATSRTTPALTMVRHCIRPRKKAAPKDAIVTAAIRAQAWATRRAKYAGEPHGTWLRPTSATTS